MTRNIISENDALKSFRNAPENQVREIVIPIKTDNPDNLNFNSNLVDTQNIDILRDFLNKTGVKQIIVQKENQEPTSLNRIQSTLEQYDYICSIENIQIFEFSGPSSEIHRILKELKIPHLILSENIVLCVVKDMNEKAFLNVLESYNLGISPKEKILIPGRYLKGQKNLSILNIYLAEENPKSAKTEPNQSKTEKPTTEEPTKSEEREPEQDLLNVDDPSIFPEKFGEKPEGHLRRFVDFLTSETEGVFSVEIATERSSKVKGIWIDRRKKRYEMLSRLPELFEGKNHSTHIATKPTNETYVLRIETEDTTKKGVSKLRESWKNAKSLAKMLENEGISYILLYSGRSSFHFWLPSKEAISREEARRIADYLESKGFRLDKQVSTTLNHTLPIPEAKRLRKGSVKGKYCGIVKLFRGENQVRKLLNYARPSKVSFDISTLLKGSNSKQGWSSTSPTLLRPLYVEKIAKFLIENGLVGNFEKNIKGRKTSLFLGATLLKKGLSLRTISNILLKTFELALKEKAKDTTEAITLKEKLKHALSDLVRTARRIERSKEEIEEFLKYCEERGIELYPYVYTEVKPEEIKGFEGLKEVIAEAEKDPEKRTKIEIELQSLLDEAIQHTKPEREATEYNNKPIYFALTTKTGKYRHYIADFSTKGIYRVIWENSDKEPEIDEVLLEAGFEVIPIEKNNKIFWKYPKILREAPVMRGIPKEIRKISLVSQVGLNEHEEKYKVLWEYFPNKTAKTTRTIPYEGTLDYIFKKLESEGKIFEENKPSLVFKQLINKLEEEGRIIEETESKEKGIFFIDNQLKAVGLDVHSDKEKLKEGLEALQKIYEAYPENYKGHFKAVMLYSMISPFFHVLRDIKKDFEVFRPLVLEGEGDTGKTKLAKIGTSLWWKPIENSSQALSRTTHQITKSATYYQFAIDVQSLTIPIIYDESEELLKDAKIVEKIKVMKESPVVHKDMRTYYRDGKGRQFYAICPFIITYNPNQNTYKQNFLDFDPGLVRRVIRISFVDRFLDKEAKKRYQKEIEPLFSKLHLVGGYVLSLLNERITLNMLEGDLWEMATTIWKIVFEEADIPLPEWLTDKVQMNFSTGEEALSQKRKNDIEFILNRIKTLFVEKKRQYAPKSNGSFDSFDFFKFDKDLKKEILASIGFLEYAPRRGEVKILSSIFKDPEIKKEVDLNTLRHLAREMQNFEIDCEFTKDGKGRMTIQLTEEDFLKWIGEIDEEEEKQDKTNAHTSGGWEEADPEDLIGD